MAYDINTLLNQESWTGKEVGQAIMANLINDIRNITANEESKPLFTQEFLRQMESTLKEPEEQLDYGVYLDIYTSVSDCYNRVQGLFQQFFHGFYRCLLMLEHAHNADAALSELAGYPLIMTQSQYDRIKDQPVETEPVFEYDEDDFEQVVKKCKLFYEGKDAAIDYDNVKPKYNGIAIIQNPHPSQVDKNGNYKQPEMKKFDVLTHFAEDESNNPIELIHTLIIPALKHLYAYNDFIDIIGDIYDIADIEILKCDMEYPEEKIDGYNTLLYIFYASVHGDESEKKRKRKLIKKVFEPVDPIRQRPSAKSVKAVKTRLKRLGFTEETQMQLKNFTMLIRDLIGEERRL